MLNRSTTLVSVAAAAEVFLWHLMVEGDPTQMVIQRSMILTLWGVVCFIIISIAVYKGCIETIFNIKIYTQAVPLICWLVLYEVARGGFSQCCEQQTTLKSFNGLPILVILIPLTYWVYKKGECSLSELTFPGVISSFLFVIQYDRESVGCYHGCVLPSVFLLSISMSSIVTHLCTSPFILINSLIVSFLSIFTLGEHSYAGLSLCIVANRLLLSHGIGQLASQKGISNVVLTLILGVTVTEIVKNQSFVELSIVALCASAILAKLTLNEGRSSGDVINWCTLSDKMTIAVSVLELIVVSVVSCGSDDGDGMSKDLCSEKHIPVSQLLPPSRLANGTIVFMDSKRKPIRKQLLLFQKHFLSCWPYPIHVFKEEVTHEYRSEVQRSTTSKVKFIEIGHIFDKPPNNITMDTINFWIKVKKYGRGHHFGYRMMCRFFSGVFASYKFLQQFEYYWRLDTDSWFHQEVLVDPFRQMLIKGCKYGHMDKAHRDSPDVTHMLYETALEWAENFEIPVENIARLKKKVLDKDGNYRRPMFYNNFELGSIPWISGDTYKSFFEYLDHTDGFMKYRWGDAPVRTLAVHLLLEDADLCDFERIIPYHHGRYRNKGYRPSDHPPPTCPSRNMVLEKGIYSYPPKYINSTSASQPLTAQPTTECKKQKSKSIPHTAFGKERFFMCLATIITGVVVLWAGWQHEVV